MNPPVRRVFVESQYTLLTGHRPEVVKTITGSRRYGMIAVRQENRVPVSHLMRYRFAVVRVDRLISKSLGWIDPEVIDLFQLRLTIAAVVLVRRETAPMTWWGES